MRSSAASVPFITPAALARSIRSRSASVCSHARPVRRTPALLTQTSSVPARAAVARAASRQACASPTSRVEDQAPPPMSWAAASALSPSTSVTWTCSPRCASRRAISRPSPRPPPVTRAPPLMAPNPVRPDDCLGKDRGTTPGGPTWEGSIVNVGQLALRGIIGPLFVGHGAQKLFGWFGGHGLDGTAGFFEGQLGLRPGKRHATAAGVTEFAGGALLTAGALTPLASAALTGTMVTAIRKAHAKNGIWSTAGGYEYNL